MALNVVCFSTYRTSIVGEWRSGDYNARDFIYAVKDRDINGYAYVKLRGAWQLFNNANRQDVVDWFAIMVTDYLAANPVASPIALVPVPGSKVHTQFANTPRTAQLAHAIAAAMGGNVTVADVLRWQEPMLSANEEGGTRDPAELFAKLKLMNDVAELRIVLVDDVFTSGGHMQACAAKLREGGAKVLMAVVAGRADQEQVPDPFTFRSEYVADYEP